MNLTDLTSELHARAGEPTGTPVAPAVNRLADVRHRIQARRRRQAAGVAGAVALSLATVFLGLRLTEGPARGASPAGTDTAAPTTFVADLAGDPLVANRVGTAGQQDLIVRYTPTATNLFVSTYCRLPGAGDGIVRAALTVNGNPMATSDCRPDAEPNQQTLSWGEDPEVGRAGWKLAGLKVGREMQFRLRVTGARPGFDPGGEVRLGVGIYASRASRVEVVPWVWVPWLTDAAGHRYNLWKIFSHTIDAGSAEDRRESVGWSAGRYPAWVIWGLTDAEPGERPSGEARLLIDGKPGPTTTVVGVVARDELRDAGAHTVVLQATPGSRGRINVGYYLRTD